MWMALAAGYLLGCVCLYAYMMLTAEEPADDRCVDCYLPGCRECPYAAETAVRQRLRAA